jgi:hypothetical protein
MRYIPGTFDRVLRIKILGELIAEELYTEYKVMF